ncbi:MAG: PepSY-associated TM helix domain-containing protein [Steroidobacteraceae bacterium]
MNARASSRAQWMKRLHTWHWISSALCLIGMILFAATGITLNHAAQIPAKPRVERQQAVLPDALQASLRAVTDTQPAPLPAPLREWLAQRWSVVAEERAAEWRAEEIYLSLPRPGGDAWLSIDRATGEVEYERTDHGWIAYLNDLHKGRHTGASWNWFIDLFAATCLMFSITGLLLLKLHAPRRPSTWPLVGMGLAIPVLLLVLFHL